MASTDAEPQPIFWNDLALYEQQRIVTKLHAAGKQTTRPTHTATVQASGATGKATVDGAGIITIPSAATSSPLENTFGLWDMTTPIEIELQAGTNVLKFQGPARVTIDHFTLTPST